MSPARPDPRVPPAPAPQHLAGQELHPVHLQRVPLRLWERASVHTAELIREFFLLTSGAEQGLHPTPQRLLDLVEDLRARYAGVSRNRRSSASPPLRRDV